MSGNQQEAWGGEVRMPGWMRRLLRRPDDPGPTPEAAHEARKPPPSATSVAANANKAAIGPLGEIYHEGRRKRR
jgi:hypothetical protein